MNMRVTGSYPAGLTSPVDKRIGDAFPIIEEVYKHLKQLKYLAENSEKFVDKQIEFRANTALGVIEWRYDDQPGWLVLVSYDELTGVDISSMEETLNQIIDNGVQTLTDKFIEGMTQYAGNIVAGAEWIPVPSHANNQFDAQAIALTQRTELLRQRTDKAVLSYPDYAAASAAAATLPDGQVVEAPDVDGRLSRFEVQGGSLVYKSLAADAESTSFNQAGPGAVATTVQEKLRESVSVKDFGAVGDGVTDDTAAIQAGMNHAATCGGVLFIPHGTYSISGVLGLSSAAKPFSIIGAGRDATRIVRSSDFNGSLVNIISCNNWLVSDLSLDGNHSVLPNGNHGISWSNCSHVRILRVNVYDWKNSAIIGFSSPASLDYIDNIIEDCWVDGGGAANNGILLADLQRSGLTNCSAVNIGKSGSPCYALQLKNGCRNCFIEGGLATGASVGVACGNYDVAGTHAENLIRGVRIFDCESGIAFGGAVGNTASSLIIDMNNAGNHAVDLNANSVGCSIHGVSVFNLAVGKEAVRFRSGDTDNTVEIASISNSSGLIQRGAVFLVGSLRNSVKLGRYVSPAATPLSDLVLNPSGSSTNSFLYEQFPIKQSSNIAGGAVVIRDSSVRLMCVDTQGGAATDELDSITNGTDGQIITIDTASNLRDVTVKHLAPGGNIRLNGLADFTLDAVADSLTLIFKSALGQWCECSRSNNA